MSRSALKDIERAIRLLERELNNVTAQIDRLEQVRRELARGRVLRVSVEVEERGLAGARPRQRGPRRITSAQRVATSKRMKAYWAARRSAEGRPEPDRSKKKSPKTLADYLRRRMQRDD